METTNDEKDPEVLRRKRDEAREARINWEKRERELSAMIGATPATDISSKHTAEAEAKSLFDRMTPAELMELYQTDRERWEKVMESVESAGLRKLRDVSYPPMG